MDKRQRIQVRRGDHGSTIYTRSTGNIQLNGEVVEGPAPTRGRLASFTLTGEEFDRLATFVADARRDHALRGA